MKKICSFLICVSLFACKNEKASLILTSEDKKVSITPERATLTDNGKGGYDVLVSSEEPAVQLEIGRQPSNSDLRVVCTYGHQQYVLDNHGNLSNNITVNNTQHRFSVHSELNLKSVENGEPLKILLDLPNVTKE